MLANDLLNAKYLYKMFYKQSRQEKSSSNTKTINHLKAA